MQSVRRGLRVEDRQPGEKRKKRVTPPKTAFEVFKCSGANVYRGQMQISKCSGQKPRSVQVFRSQCLQGFHAGFRSVQVEEREVFGPCAANVYAGFLGVGTLRKPVEG